LIVRPDESVVRYEYVRGPFRGHGTWSFRPLGETTVVSYAIRLRPTHLIFALVAATPMFRLKHSWDIRRILARLAKRVGGAEPK
jgi:ribosome-associated toxin RatA of RatAB toxin-antitoxin module